SRWKNMEQINDCGVRAASRHENLEYWTFNWRKKGGSARMLEISKREKFYMQEYCGCAYSLRDTNKWRMANDRPKIEIGKNYYEVQHRFFKINFSYTELIITIAGTKARL